MSKDSEKIIKEKFGDKLFTLVNDPDHMLYVVEKVDKLDLTNSDKEKLLDDLSKLNTEERKDLIKTINQRLGLL